MIDTHKLNDNPIETYSTRRGSSSQPEYIFLTRPGGSGRKDPKSCDLLFGRSCSVDNPFENPSFTEHERYHERINPAGHPFRNVLRQRIRTYCIFLAQLRR